MEVHYELKVMEIQTELLKLDAQLLANYMDNLRNKHQYPEDYDIADHRIANLLEASEIIKEHLVTYLKRRE